MRKKETGRKWPEEAEWARVGVIGLLGKVILICVVLSRKSKDPEVLAALSLMIAVMKICQDWLKEAKSGQTPTEISKRVERLLTEYQ